MPDALTLAVALAGTGVAAAIDLRTRRVPNRLTTSIGILGLMLAAAGLGRVELPSAVAGACLGASLMLPGYLFGATGGGDVKLLAAAGTLLGPTNTVRAFLFTLIAGGVLALIAAIHRRRVRASLSRLRELVGTVGATAERIEYPPADNRFAYAPAIAVGVVAAAVLV